MRGLAKGAKRAGGRFSGGIDLLTLGEVIAITKPGRELATLTDWSLVKPWRALRTNLLANQTAYYLIDLVQRLLAPSDPHPRLFEALVGAIDRTEAGQAASATLSFQWTLLDELGYRPRVELPPDGGASLWFSPDAGGTIEGIVPDARPNLWRVRRQTIGLLVALSEATDTSEIAQAADADTLARANRLLAAYIRHQVGATITTMRLLFPEL